MRRNIAVMALMAIMAVGLAGTPAHAATTRIYRGELSDGRSIRLEFHRGGGGNLRLNELDFNAKLTCDDGSTMTFGVGYGFGGGGPIVRDGAFSFDDFDFMEALHLHGTIGPRRGSGDFRFTIAALTEDEQAQLCTTGDLTWSALRINATSPAAAGPIPDVRIRDRAGADAAAPVVTISS
jgi:hypothetical protein